MLDPAGITLGQISSTARDLSIVGTLIVIAWKARGVYEAAANFFKRTSNHMDAMEIFAKTVVDNHLRHIERDIARIARQQVRATDSEQADYEVSDVLKVSSES
jgi:hypothetical protein